MSGGSHITLNTVPSGYSTTQDRGVKTQAMRRRAVPAMSRSSVPLHGILHNLEDSASDTDQEFLFTGKRRRAQDPQLQDSQFQSPQPQAPTILHDARISTQVPSVASFDPAGFLIDVTVGSATIQSYDARNLFHVHEGVICPRSGFFKGLMNNNWREKEDGAVFLPDDEPAAFRQYLKILYGQPIVFESSNGETEADHEKNHAEQSTILAQIFILADKLLDPVTRKLMVDTILAHAFKDMFPSLSGTCQVRAPSTAAVNHIYENTAGACTIRRMVVDLYLGALAPEVIHTAGIEFAGELVEDFKYDVESEVVRRKGDANIEKEQSYSNSEYLDPRKYRE